MIKFKLKEILEKEGLSQNRFSKMCDVRPNTINNICNNNLKRLELCTLEKILKALKKMGYGIEDVIDFYEE